LHVFNGSSSWGVIDESNLLISWSNPEWLIAIFPSRPGSGGVGAPPGRGFFPVQQSQRGAISFRFESDRSAVAADPLVTATSLLV
jgi:hypothetical protein